MHRLLSNYFYKKPKLLFSLYQKIFKLGFKLDMDRAMMTVRRPEWLLYDMKSEYEHPIHYTQADKSTDENLRLCSRIMDAFKKATEDENEQGKGCESGSLWGVIINNHLKELLTALYSGDPKQVQAQLNEGFKKEFVFGYACGSFFDSAPHRLRFASLGISQYLAALGEELGVIPAECSEHIVSNKPRRKPTGTMVKEIAEILKIDLDFPKVAAPYGVKHGDCLFTPESPLHIFGAKRILQVLDRYAQDLNGPLNILEIGGGYGGTAYWLHKMLGERIHSYTIIDLPTTNVMQGYFLSNALPEKKVQLYKEGELICERGVISITPHFTLNRIKGKINFVINQDSMPEMPESEARKYFAWMNENLDGLFYSFNQEGNTEFNGKRQLVVPQFAKECSAFQRVDRQLPQIRRGYVEEVYRVKR